MSAGEVAEFDTPEALFLQGGIFAEMCEKSNIDLAEIRQAGGMDQAKDSGIESTDIKQA